jgi:hypothetical protein
MVMQRLFARVCASACCNHIRVEPGHAVLLLLLQAGAAEKGVPLYKYIAQLAGNSKLVRVELSTYSTRSNRGSTTLLQQTDA